MRQIGLRLHTICTLLVLIGLLTCAHAQAAPPWQTLAPFKKIEADPDSSYPVTEENGPWMIMATTFRGENAEQQAQDLVFELRNHYRLPAYTYSKTFDYTKPERGKGLNPDGSPKTMRYQQAGVIKEVAVLVGDYDTIDDPGAQRTLAKIKDMEPKAAESNARSLASMIPSGAKKQRKGPLGHAFVTKNPGLPREFFAAKGIDRLVMEMNKDVPHSLLECRGKYTIKVATFNGAVLLDQKKIEQVERGKKMKSKLAEAAEKAHLLTMELRKLGYEAYEFHDRESSVVCVGGFSSLGAPRADGGVELHPTVKKMIEVFAADPAGIAAGGAAKPKTVAGITLDMQPMPMEVPQRSIAADYQRSMASQR